MDLDDTMLALVIATAPPSIAGRIILLQLPPDERLEAAKKLDMPRDRSRHTYATWAKALDSYRDVGLAEAASRTGVPRRTISRWARESGLRCGRSPAAREAAARRLERSRYVHPASPEGIAEWLKSQPTPADNRPWRARSRHTAGARRLALQLYIEVGPREAARRTGIPLRTLARWAKSSRLVPPPGSTDRTRAATAARRESGARQRRMLIRMMCGVTREQSEQIEARRSEPAPEPAFSLARHIAAVQDSRGNPAR
jgi:DNA-binding transcriptional MerR regulator